MDRIIAPGGASLAAQDAMESFVHTTIAVASVLGFVVGAYQQSIYLMTCIIAAGTLLCVVAIGPAWKFWGEDNISWVSREEVNKWLSDLGAKEQADSDQATADAKSGKRAASPVKPAGKKN